VTRLPGAIDVGGGATTRKLAAPFSCLVPQQDVVGVRDPVHEALAEAQRVYGREARIVDAQANERQPCRAAAVAGGGAEGLGRGVGRGREGVALGFAGRLHQRSASELWRLQVVWSTVPSSVRTFCPSR